MLFAYYFALLFVAASARRVPFYRKDYTYIEDLDAFYKLHWDASGTSFNTAFQKCEDEGATLFYPKQKDEWTVVRNLTASLAEQPNVTTAFVGLHDEFGFGEYITVDGQSTPNPIFETFQAHTSGCVSMDILTGTYNVEPCTSESEPLLYVCKKSDDESCPTIDRGYTFNDITKKCYKISERFQSWQNAMRTCYMEGAMLVVRDNKISFDILVDSMTQLTYYYVGIRKMFGSNYYHTVKGSKYDVNFDNYLSGDRESSECVAIYHDGSRVFFSSSDCDENLNFICEMDTKSKIAA